MTIFLSWCTRARKEIALYSDPGFGIFCANPKFGNE